MSKQLTVLEPEVCCAPLAAATVPAEAAADLAAAFKALGDPVRLQLLSMIASADGGEACVCDLTPAFDLTGPTISHHLKVLREAGLVESDRRGTWVWYRANRPRMAALSAVLDIAPAG
ncbi:ArsR/SmtB family transcription factor [Catellatospora vulcania]|uniref:ArsR/SmtB family transcription factor n=1 Tax=Catellatospora vulcania TaxID=1460450 RepID=UPI0012D475B2|nr:metalloregulator ArsR/SmtB family transcription factor [Catellatospora vulcania]